MNANAFHYLFEYHFGENRKMWDDYLVPLSFKQFNQDSSYSQGSARGQIVHLMSVDEAWFSELRGVPPSEPVPPSDQDDRSILRTRWDGIEHGMRNYLAGLQDAMLFSRPIREPEEDTNLMVWQVLLHIVNHGTDHRAQLLRQLHDLGAKTTSQDFIFYVYDHP
jgi:uncharacterized damage-inducible protein DinB